VASIAEQRFGSGPWPWILLAASSFVLASNHVLGRYVSGDIPPMGLAFWRVIVGALVLLPFAWRDFITKWPVIKRHWKLFLAMAFVFMPMGNAAIYLAYNFTSAINGAVIATAQPALTMLLAWFVLHHPVTRLQIFGVLVAALGVLVIILRGDLTALMTLSLHGGDLIMLLAISGFALYTVLLRRVPAEIGPILILIVVQILGAITLAPFYLIESLTYLAVPMTLESFLVILWVGTAVAVVAVGLGNISVLALGPGKASIGNYLRALFAAAMATILLGETLEMFHLVAFALVILGVLLMTLGPTPAPRTALR
jgi:drug/metabolite transporter (DMT)-like permease